MHRVSTDNDYLINIKGKTMLKSISAGICALCVLCASNALLAQESNTSCSVRGLYAVQFAMDKDFDFGAFEGGVISLKYNLTEQWALRLGLSASLYQGSDDLRRTNDDQNYVIEGEGKGQQLGVTLTALKCLRATEMTRFYLGAGPFFNFDRMDEKTERWTEAYTKVDYDRYKRAYGMHVVAVAEVYLKKYVSLFVEYGVALTYEKWRLEGNPRPTDNSMTEESTMQHYALRAKPFQLGFSIYF